MIDCNILATDRRHRPYTTGGNIMLKVKTFTNELKALQTMKELNDLDAQVNQFIEANQVQRVVSVSDSCTSAGGDTIGIIRVLTYESD